MSLVKSLYHSQSDIITSIVRLYCPNGIDLDITYSYGSMYTGTGIQPKITSDIAQFKNQIVADSRNLPFEDNSFQSVVFDPPFLATTGKSLLKKDSSNKIAKRFTVFPDEISLHKFYKETLKEVHRILDKNGILIFKCQDKVSSGKQYLSHIYIINKAVEIGFYPLDIFIFHNKSRMTPAWQTKNQKHARKFHCYFLILKKTGFKIKYE